MKVTNRKDLPEIIVNAVKNDPYDSGGADYSATSLIKPAYMVNLEKQHGAEAERDVADMLWALYGTAVHHIIERAATPSDLVEERFFDTVLDKKISAQIDHFKDGVITDFKLTGAYKVKKAMQGEGLEDWENQLNIQAYLMQQNGYRIEKVQIMAMVRDWSRSKWNPSSFEHEEGYPDQIEIIDIDLWPIRKQKEYIEGCLMDLERPQPCTSEERWQQPPKYALKKNGAGRALKVESTMQAIEQYAVDKGHASLAREFGQKDVKLQLKPGLVIETRESPNRRCLDYCSVNKFCDFYRKTYASKEELPFK